MAWHKVKNVLAVLILCFVLGGSTPLAHGQIRISIGVTETMETFNPYGDSVALLYSIWCQVMGCLGTYDFDKGEHVGTLVERWEVKDPNTWLFYLRKNLRFHDGSRLTAADVVHSFNRTRNDPQSKQKQNIAPVASVAVVDDYTVRFTTKQPTAPLLASS